MFDEHNKNTNQNNNYNNKKKRKQHYGKVKIKNLAALEGVGVGRREGDVLTYYPASVLPCKHTTLIQH